MLVIRNFDLDRDYEAAHALWQASGPGVRVSPLSDSRAELAKKLARDPDLFLVADLDGQVIGTVIGGFDGRRGLVYHLAVALSQRRQGLGRRLMAELEGRLHGKGCRKYYLLVSPTIPESVAFYESFGFESMPYLIMGKEVAEPVAEEASEA